MWRVSTPVSASSSATIGPQSVAIKEVAVQGLGVQHKPTAFRHGGWGRHRHLAAELIRRPGLPLADAAFDLGRVQRIDLAAALPVILQTHPYCQRDQVGEAFLKCCVAGDLAPGIADHAAEPNAQELERAPSPLELVRVRQVRQIGPGLALRIALQDEQPATSRVGSALAPAAGRGATGRTGAAPPRVEDNEKTAVIKGRISAIRRRGWSSASRPR
jgi:hypothetical protein